MKTLSWLITFLAVPLGASAQIAPDIHPTHFGALTFYLENDSFAGTDRDYTNGARISWTSPSLKRFSEDSNVGGLAGWFDDVPLMGDSSYDRNVAISLGQSMFTPVDVRNQAVVLSERPYAGWLYVGLGLVWKKPHVKNTLLFNVGVVGPWSLAEEAQRAVHDYLGQRSPAGWDNQLGNEIGINMSYERKWRLHRDVSHGLDWDFLPYVGATLGNVHTHGAAGAELRFGWNLPDDFGTGAINDSATTPTPLEGIDAKPWANRFGFHVFGRAEGRAVLQNIFLDGNTFRHSHSVDKYPYVADLSVGFAVNWRNSKLSYAYIYRTREFKGQPEGQLFGAITLSIFF